MQGAEAGVPARTPLPRPPRTPLRHGPASCDDQPSPACRQLDIVMNEVTEEVKDLWEAQGVPYDAAWLHNDLMRHFTESSKAQSKALDNDWSGFVSIAHTLRNPPRRDQDITDNQHHMLHGMRRDVLRLYRKELEEYWKVREVSRFVREGLPPLCTPEQPAMATPAGAQTLQSPAASTSTAASHETAGSSTIDAPIYMSGSSPVAETSQPGRCSSIQVPTARDSAPVSAAVADPGSAPAAATSAAGPASGSAASAAHDGGPYPALTPDAPSATASPGAAWASVMTPAYSNRAHLPPAIQALWRMRDGTLRPWPSEQERHALGIPPPRSPEYQAVWPVDALVMVERAQQLKAGLREELRRRRLDMSEGRHAAAASSSGDQHLREGGLPNAGAAAPQMSPESHAGMPQQAGAGPSGASAYGPAADILFSPGFSASGGPDAAVLEAARNFAAADEAFAEAVGGETSGSTGTISAAFYIFILCSTPRFCVPTCNGDKAVWGSLMSNERAVHDETIVLEQYNVA